VDLGLSQQTRLEGQTCLTQSAKRSRDRLGVDAATVVFQSRLGMPYRGGRGGGREGVFLKVEKSFVAECKRGSGVCGLPCLWRGPAQALTWFPSSHRVHNCSLLGYIDVYEIGVLPRTMGGADMYAEAA